MVTQNTMTGQYITDAILVPGRARSPPDDGAGGDRKRRRKVLSCYDCRRRKLQCDRVMPACGRCVKAGQESSCVYSEDATDPLFRSSKPSGPEQSGPSTADPVSASSYSDVPLNDLPTKMRFQERRIQQLEAALARTTSNRLEAVAARQFEVLKHPLTPESVHDSGLGSNINDRETMLLRGRAFETQFSGTTHPLSLIAHVPELNLFTKEAIERYPSFQRARQDIGALEARTKCADKHHFRLSDEELHTLLPPQTEANRAVDLYLESYDRIYHVMHAPSFWDAYHSMWRGNLRDAPRHTVVTVLLMVACVSCVGPAHPWKYIANSSKAREGAIVITQACESWIDRQSQKRVSAADFQIRFLLCLTKQTTARKYKRTWTEIGNLLRFCMSAGLHRNPELIRRPTTPLEKELRRRIWAAVLDFELQASFDRGMISAPWFLQSDTPAPNNLHDEEIATTQSPSPRPAKEFTSAWYLSASNNTVMLRSTLNTILNNIRHVLTFEQVKQYTDEIETHLSSVSDLSDLSAPEAEEAHSLFRLKLLQYQLALHNRFLRSTIKSSERMFSTMVILETASKIINIHQSLTADDKRALQFLGYDLLRASLSMANVVSVQTLEPGNLLTPIVFQHTPLMHEAIQMLTDKAARLGCEQRQMWVALAALGFVKSRQNSGQRNEYMKEAVDVITKTYDEIMAYQDGGASVRREAQELMGSRGIVDYLPAVSGQPDEPDAAMVSINAALFNFDDFAAWTFEDWMFDPNDPSLTINGT